MVPSKSLVDTVEERTALHARLTRAWTGSNRKVAHLGGNPVSLSRTMLDKELTPDVPHVVGLKSDGVRYILYLCLREDGSPVALMIDRAQNMYEVEVMASEDHFQKETIFEGELVWHQPQEVSLVFLVFDAVMIKGESMTNRPFMQRMEMVERYTRPSEELTSLVGDMEELEARVAETDAIVILHFHPSIVVKPKRFVALQHTESVWQGRAEAQHRVDGLVIHRCDAPYRNGTATRSIYKWKHAHSIDLKGPPHALHHSTGPLDDSTFEGKTLHVLPSKVIITHEEDVAEYHVEASPTEVRLFAMRTRPDKKVANSIGVIRATIQDCIDDISPTEIASRG